MKWWKKRGPMPERFEVLARYNAEKARGILHSPKWNTQMKEVQAEFDAWTQGRRT